MRYRFPEAPRLDGDRGSDCRLDARACVASISGRLAAQYQHSRLQVSHFENVSLASGAAGHALMLAYASRLLDQPALMDAAVLAFDIAVQGVEQLEAGPGLFEGIAGVGWVGAHLATSMGWDPSPTTTIAEILTDALDATPLWPSGHDLINGVVGLGVYGLASAAATGEDALAKAAVRALERLAEGGQPEAAWFTPTSAIPPSRRRQYPSGVLDLGIAHGVAGVVAFLARAVQADIERARALELLPYGVQTLLAHRSQVPGSRYPAKVLEAGPVPARLAWCYGDLGVAAALSEASAVGGHTEWRSEALAAAEAARDTGLRESGVVDASVCHGAAGIAHMLRRLSGALSNASLDEAAAYWYDELSAPMYRDMNNCFVYRRATTPPTIVVVDGFLEGQSGVALVCLAKANDQLHGWDEVLLAPSSSVTPPVDAIV